MKLSVHLSFDGTCEEAFTICTRLFGGSMVYSLRYRHSPMAASVPAKWGDKLYHATITIESLTLMGGDHQNDVQTPQGFSLVVNPPTVEDAQRIFADLAQDGQVQMPIQETFRTA